MLGFFKRKKLIKAYLRGTATLMYRDVSDDPWDRENLTKRNLGFSIDSVRYIDRYTTRLMSTDLGDKLLREHFDIFVARIGAYIGEVIKENTRQDFDWYEFESVAAYTYKLDGVYKSIETESLLYSKDRDTVLFPMLGVSQFLKGNSPYPNFLTFVEEEIKQNS
jgi:hypothetical protein